MLSDLSGLSGPRLGFGMDSGWSHLSGSSHTLSSGDSMSIDFDKIAEDAVNEEFGFRRGGGGRVWAARHPVRAANRRAARRDYNRGGWGSPGWQADQAGGGYYAEPAYEEPAYEEEYVEEGGEYEEMDPEEMSEEEFGAYLAAYGEEDEFGRFRPVRRARRRRARRQNRRARRQERRSQIQSSSSFSPPEPSGGGYEEEPLESDPYFLDDEEEEDSYGEYQPSRWHQRRGGPVVAAEEAYGNDLPVPRQSTFRQSLDTGLGFGLGFLGVAVGLNILASALGGRR